jgi:SpoVK/Ycf46/Vps4 family AAA+-type ATPase
MPSAGINVLLVGGSAADRELAAATISGELDADLYRIDLSGLQSRYIGETEKGLQAILQRAESRGWVLYFDEADALFGRRTSVDDAHNRYANIEVAYLLEMLQAHCGLAVVAAGTREQISESAVARFPYVIELSQEESRALHASSRKPMQS